MIKTISAYLEEIIEGYLHPSSARQYHHLSYLGSLCFLCAIALFYSQDHQLYQNSYAIEDLSKGNSIMSDSQYPWIYYNKSSQVLEKTFVSQGIIISRNFTGSALDLIQWPWEEDQDNLKIGKTQIMNFPFDTLSGKTYSEADGLIANLYNYTGRYLSLIVGDVQKKGEFQVSFSIVVNGQINDYIIRFVHGPLGVSGWYGTTYFEKIDSNDSKLVDLQNLLASHGDEYISTDEIVIIVQKNSTLNYLEYAVSVGKATESLPAEVEGGNFVRGTIVDANYSLNGSKSLFHDFSLWQSVKLQFENVPVDSKVSANGWEIFEIKNLNKRPSDDTFDVLVTAIKEVPLYSAIPYLFMNLDFWGSVTNLGPKDYLFLAILIALIYSLFSLHNVTTTSRIGNGSLQ